MTVCFDMILRECVSARMRDMECLWICLCVCIYVCLHHGSLHRLPVLQSACGDKQKMKASVCVCACAFACVRACMCTCAHVSYLSLLCIVGWGEWVGDHWSKDVQFIADWCSAARALPTTVWSIWEREQERERRCQGDRDVNLWHLMQFL